MNILHLTHTDTRFDNRILKEIGALSDTKLYNILCIGVASDERAAMSKSIPDAKIRTLSLITKMPKWVPRPIRHTLMFTELYLRFTVLGIRHKPKIIHCHDTMVLAIGVIIKIISKSKLIYDAHELESNKNGQSKILAKATLYIEKACWSYVDHLISVSDSIIEWYNNNLGAKKSTLILNSPLIKSSEVKKGNYFHDLYDIEPSKSVFIYLGILGRGRGIDLILEAFCDENIESHIVFVGYGEFEKKIFDIAQIENNIHLHEAVPHEDVVSLVASADVGLCLIENVSLSDYYCLPNKLFEYAFAGLPILTSDFPDITKMVHKYNLGKVCSVSSKSILSTIKEIEMKPLDRPSSDLTELGWHKQVERLIHSYDMNLNN
jgi:glycosyltransferase involved in cell wall biosynthesis